MQFHYQQKITIMKKRILLVDDNLSFYRSFSLAFKDQFDLTHCSTIVATFAVLKKKNQFDLLLIDLELDNNTIELEGLELIQKIKTSRHYRYIPIIAISKYLNNPAIRRDSFNIGADEVLLKSSFDISNWSKLFIKTISRHQF